MPHLLIIDLPGGNDTDILDAALRLGCEFSFLTSDLGHYERQEIVQKKLIKAITCLEIKSFDYSHVEAEIEKLNSIHPIDAVISLLDTRLIDAAKLADKLDLPYLKPEAAVLLRDKSLVRQRLSEKGISQPAYLKAETTSELISAVEQMGLPVLIKPVDGYGSQNIVVLQEKADLDPWINPLHDMLPVGADYGLGVYARDKLVIERYLTGRLLGCDTLTFAGKHQLLGVHEKKMFSPPSFAIQGGTFRSRCAEHEVIENYVFSVLDAVGFNCGAAHVEIMLTKEGPQLIEINPRLVGAKIARLSSHGLGYSVHEALIRLHLGDTDFPVPKSSKPAIAVSRWIVAPSAGLMKDLALPDSSDSRIKEIDILAKTGDRVNLPFENADRLGVVMAAGDTSEDVEQFLEKFIQRIQVKVHSIE
jgi:biotin carboxylase